MTRFPQLDILRALALFLVISFHVENIPVINKVGWIALDCFFVLSGFLISGLLFDELKRTSTIDLKRFWIRRGLKIYPAFVFMMIFLRAADPREVAYWKEFTFFQNFHGHPWSHTWSLAVEEHFYLVLPIIVIWLALRGRLHLIPIIGAALVLFCLGLRSWIVINGHSMDFAYRSTQCRVDGPFAGVVLGYLFHYHHAIFERLKTWKAGALCGLFLLPCFLLQTNRALSLPIVITTNIIAFVLLVGWSIQQPWMQSKALQRIGMDSYSIYLWHLPVIHLFKTFSPSPLLTVTCYVASIVVGILMAQIIEIPVLEFRNRIFPHLRTLAVPAPVQSAFGESLPLA